MLDGDDEFVLQDSLDAWVLATWSRALVYAQSLLRHRPGASHRSIDLVHPTAAEPSTIVLHEEQEHAIETALARLPETQRAAVEWKGLGHSLDEIAAILDVSASNAGVLVFRGRQALPKYLAPYLVGQTG